MTIIDTLQIKKLRIRDISNERAFGHTVSNDRTGI